MQQTIMLFFCVVSLFLSCVGSSIGQQATLADIVETNPNLSELKNLINTNNSDLLQVTLRSPTPDFTVFAPNNEAIKNFAQHYPNVAANSTMIREILLNHVLVNVSVQASEVTSNLGVFSAIGYPLWFFKTAEAVSVNEARVVFADQMATNGVLHIIDEVLYPIGVLKTVGEAVMMDPAFSGLKAYVDKAPEVRNILTNKSRLVTVFAPTNEALPSSEYFNNNDVEALLKRHACVETVLFAEYFNSDRRIETYHGDILTKKMDNNIYVTNSGDLWARVVSKSGIPTLNGVVHQINGVLGLTSGVNLVEALFLNGLTKLKNNILNEKLDSALMDPVENYTIFAPSNTAFDRFVKPSEVALSTILKRHVIKGNLLSTDLAESMTYQTLNSDETLMITKDQGKVYLEFKQIKATVISANKRAANGVIHIIDTVLSGAPPMSLSAILIIPALALLFL